MITKIFGSILIISSTFLMGNAKANGWKSQYLQMRTLYRIVSQIESEIRYARITFAEIFSRISGWEKGVYRIWLQTMSRQLNERAEGSFEKIWSQNIEKYLNNTSLSANELERLKLLGCSLGSCDLQFQIKMIDIYLQQIEEEMRNLQEEMRTKIRLCHWLGAMSGTLIAILLL